MSQSVSSEEETRSGPLFWYLTHMLGMVPEHFFSDGRVRFCCHFHPENHGSFYYYPAGERGPERVKCYGISCGIFGNLARVIALEEFGYAPDQPIDAQVRARKTKIVNEFRALGGSVPTQSSEGYPSGTLHPLLAIPGPLQRRVLSRLTDWWHWQLLADTQAARIARNYLRQRGVRGLVIERGRVLGYMPDGQDPQVSNKQLNDFYDILNVSEEELASERAWIRAQYPDVEIPDEALAFLRNKRTLAAHLGILTQDGRWKLRDRIIFSCTNALGETRFYQARLPYEPKEKRWKFLNPPNLAKYEFAMHVGMLAPKGGKAPVSRYGGTLITESPIGVAVAVGLLLTTYAVAGLGEGRLDIGHFRNLQTGRGLPTPMWCAQDNDRGRRKNSWETPSFPGQQQAKRMLAFFAQYHLPALRLLPLLSAKGFDESTLVWPEIMEARMAREYARLERRKR